MCSFYSYDSWAELYLSRLDCFFVLGWVWIRPQVESQTRTRTHKYTGTGPLMSGTSDPHSHPLGLKSAGGIVIPGRRPNSSTIGRCWLLSVHHTFFSRHFGLYVKQAAVGSMSMYGLPTITCTLCSVGWRPIWKCEFPAFLRSTNGLDLINI